MDTTEHIRRIADVGDRDLLVDLALVARLDLAPDERVVLAGDALAKIVGLLVRP